MALASPTLLAASVGANPTSGGDVTATSIASGTVTPSDNALLIIVTGAVRAGAIDLSTLVTTFTNVGTFTHYSVLATHDATRQIRLIVSVAKITGSAGTGIATVTWDQIAARRFIGIYEVASGYDTTTPVRQSKTGTVAATSMTLTLDSTPLTPSAIIAAIISYNDSNGITGDGAYTQLSETVVGTSNYLECEVSYDKDNADTTIDWSGLTATNNAAVAIEVAQAPSAFTPKVVILE